MKKVLLINPPFNIAKANYDTSVSVGLLSIATYLNEKGVAVEIIDGARQENYADLIKSKIKDFQLVGLSVMTTQIPGAMNISQLIREFNLECLIIWGGTHPTFFPEQTIQHPLVDVVNYGEGEETLYELAQGKNLEDVRGIVWKVSSKIPPSPPFIKGGKGGALRKREEDIKIITNPARELYEPAKMPLLNWDLVPREILERISLIPSLTSRGCPHRCTFCVNAILKNKWRPRPVEQVLEDLKIIKSKDFFKGKSLRFWDENFFVDIKRAKAIIDGMIENDLAIPWETTVRANYIRGGMIDDEFMARLKKSGCYLLSFGAESGSSRILKKIQKDITPEEILDSAKMCLRHDIIPQYSFMIGLPGETKEDMMMTLDLIDKLVKLDESVQILGPQAFRPYPGSPLYEECVATGRLAQGVDEPRQKAGWKEPESLEEWSYLIANELSYLTVQNFPWVQDKDFVESMEAYVRFGAHSIRSAMGSSVKAQQILKLGFVLACQLRWRLKVFNLPIEYKIAKRFVVG